MITHLIAQGFKAVPWLETSDLMKTHKEGVTFVTNKPNVIIGPNGAGKSALLMAMALKTLTHYIGSSTLDRKYLEKDVLWTTSSSWSRDYKFLAGLECDTDMGPAVFYRPNHIPGNERMLAAAMMVGYFNEAKAYGSLVDRKSSGQQSQAVQNQRVWAVLAGSMLGYGKVNWGYPNDFKVDPRYYSGELDYKARVLIDLYVKGYDGNGIPLVIMDEPEQSLDMHAEHELWKRILAADLNKVQVIVASHSAYPILNPEKFHIIEAVPGYLERARSFLLD